MLNQYDTEKLLDDMKLVAKSLKVVADENDQTKRQYAYGLAKDIANRMFRDIEEMRDLNETNGKTFGGTIDGGV